MSFAESNQLMLSFFWDDVHVSDDKLVHTQFTKSRLFWLAYYLTLGGPGCFRSCTCMALWMAQKFVLEGGLLRGIADPREKAKLFSKKWMILVCVVAVLIGR